MYYVLVYAYNKNRFILVEKNRPEWQKGKLNLVGGKMEENDKSIIDAAIRELKEETGLDAMSKPIIYGTMRDKGNSIYCLGCRVPEFPIRPAIGETEKAEWYSWSEVKSSKLLIPNLRVIIPLLANEVSDWYIRDDSGGCEVFSHKIELSVPGGLAYGDSNEKQEG